jgi:hypothetical protein
LVTSFAQDSGRQPAIDCVRVLHDNAREREGDQSLARELHSQGILSRADLLAKYDAPTLEVLKRPQGGRLAKVGKRAGRILLQARLLDSGQEQIIGTPQIPQSENYVMFDVEGKHHSEARCTPA